MTLEDVLSNRAFNEHQELYYEMLYKEYLGLWEGSPVQRKPILSRCRGHGQNSTYQDHLTWCLSGLRLDARL